MIIPEHLVHRAAEGDKEAFGLIYEAVSHELYRYALYVLRNKEDAEDAVSQCVIESFRAISSLKTAGAFKQWIFTILTRVIKRKQKELIAKRGNEDVFGDAEIFSPQNVSSEVSRSLEIQEALGTIDEEDRRIVLLSLVSGYSGKEIAAMTGLSHAAVRTRLSRIMAKLRLKLRKEDSING